MSQTKKKPGIKSARQKAAAKSRKAARRAAPQLPAAPVRPKAIRRPLPKFQLPKLSLLRSPQPVMPAWSPAAVVGLALAGSSWLMFASWPAALASNTLGTPQNLKQEFATVSQTAKSFEQQEQADHINVVSAATVQNQVNAIEVNINLDHTDTGANQLRALRANLLTWQNQLNQIAREVVGGGPTPTPSNGSLFIPIVLYHYPPANLAQQLQYLAGHGYTTVTPDQVAAAIAGTGTLPAKPVWITFDDGYENQMTAFHLLQQFNMKATFYIINGGAESNWCIGAGRKYHLPSQPAGGCGDAYLTWDQVRQLDRSGLVTIGGHTLDHEDLATLSAAQQQHEIADSKAQIEQEIGHPIDAFAYPYGDYDATTIQLVAQAGYTTAVTTLPGDYQTLNQPYTLLRIRDTLELP